MALKKKKKHKDKCWHGCVEVGFLHTVSGDAKWYRLHGKQQESCSKKVKNRTSLLFSNPTPQYISKELKSGS